MSALTDADRDLIRRAFPRDDRDRPVCIVDREPRGEEHVLCRRHWLAIPSWARAELLKLDLVGRARWLLDFRDAGGRS